MVFNTISLFIKKKKDKQILGLWSHSSTVYHLTNRSLLFQGFMVPYLTFKSMIFFFFVLWDGGWFDKNESALKTRTRKNHYLQIKLSIKPNSSPIELYTIP